MKKNLVLQLSLTTLILASVPFWAGCSHSPTKPSATSPTAPSVATQEPAAGTAPTAPKDAPAKTPAGKGAPDKSKMSLSTPGSPPAFLTSPLGNQGMASPLGNPMAANTPPPGHPMTPMVIKAPPPPVKLTLNQVVSKLATETHKDNAKVKPAAGADNHFVVTVDKPSDQVALSQIVTKYYGLYTAKRKATGHSDKDAANCVVEVVDKSGKRIAGADEHGYWPSGIAPPASVKPAAVVSPKPVAHK